ncbi:MAG: hypothetical protein ABUL60_03140 [Myxococcales bacterium]
MECKLEGILLDLDETLYSREDAFWRWIELEAQAASAAARLVKLRRQFPAGGETRR